VDITFSYDLLNEKELNLFTYTKFWPRVGASLIDRAVMLVLTPFILYNTTHWKSYLLFTGLLFVQFIYKPFLEYEYGATLGKMALGMKIVNYQNQKPGFNEIFLRNIFIVAGFTFALVMEFYKYYFKPGLAHAGFFSQILSYGTIYTIFFAADLLLVILYIVDVFFLATAKDGRSLHDRIGKTFVVKKA
jgi:uncharacterized RDD family membrane protein YckC